MLDEPQLTFLARRWLNGDSCLPFVQRLRELGHDDEAAATARLALRNPQCRDREALESALHDISNAPDGWLDALAEFAHDPSEERWQELMRFVPEEVWYQRLRNTTEVLMRLGCDGNILFRCSARIGMHSGIFDLARSGTVDPEVIEERGAGSGARATWLGLAAQAAFARGDRFAVIRYLRDASRDEDAFLAWASISEIRQEADESLNAELDKVGVPNLGGDPG
jgi:hypothetical protein